MWLGLSCWHMHHWEECSDGTPAGQESQLFDIFDTPQGKDKDLDLVSAALAYNRPAAIIVMILMVYQAIHIPTMENNLLCLMQMQTNDVKLWECPKYMEESKWQGSHAMCNLRQRWMCILFGLHGVTSYFPTCKPTQAGLATCQWLNLASEEPAWDPWSSSFQEQDDSTESMPMAWSTTKGTKSSTVLKGYVIKPVIKPFATFSPLTCSLRLIPTYMITTDQDQSGETSRYHLKQLERGKATSGQNYSPRTGIQAWTLPSKLWRLLLKEK